MTSRSKTDKHRPTQPVRHKPHKPRQHQPLKKDPAHAQRSPAA